MTLRQDIEHAINRHSAENVSNTPDYVLADYLMACLDAFDKGVNARAKHGEAPFAYKQFPAAGVHPAIAAMTPIEP